MINNYTKSQIKYLKIIGYNIRSLRENQGFSQESFALKAGLDRTYVGGVERGERNLSVINLRIENGGVIMSH